MECSFERDIDFTLRPKPGRQETPPGGRGNARATTLRSKPGKQENPSDGGGNTLATFEKEADDVLKHIHGYLNYSGGILIINNPDGRHNMIDIDNWIRKAIERLLLSIPESVVHNCVKIAPTKTRVQIYVRKSPEFVTRNYHLYTRGPGASTASVRGLSSCVDILTYDRPVDVDVEHYLCNDDITKAKCCEERSDLAENYDLEFKCWEKADNIPTKIMKDQVVGKCLSAFANLPDGGDLFAGIKQNSSSMTFVGYILSETLQQEIRKSVADLFNTFKQLSEQDELSEYRDWTTNFIKLTKCQNHSEDRYLVHIRVNHIARGVFYGEYPESFISSENGSIRQLEVHEWVTLVNKEKCTCITTYNITQRALMGDQPDQRIPDDVQVTGDAIAIGIYLGLLTNSLCSSFLPYVITGTI